MPVLPQPAPPRSPIASILFPPNCQLFAVGCHPSPRLTPVLATLAEDLQLLENKSTLSPFPTTLTRRDKSKSFVCRSYKKTPGVGEPVFFFDRCSPFLACVTHTNSRNSNPLIGLLHNSLDTRGWGHADQDRPPNPSFRVQLSTFDFRPLPQTTVQQSRVTDHGTRTLSHEPTHL